MKDKVLKAISDYGLLDNTNSVTVALSGGADSMSLLYVLSELKEEFNIDIYAAHFNHLIRGAEADRDEQFVRGKCKRLGIKLFCERADVPEYAKEKHISLELAARELRYEFLNRVAIGNVATAHTADDNTETVIFNLSRGASLKGMCGIPPKRDKFIRPLIYCTRDDVERYCKNNSISYVTDSTNLCDDYSRNNIRHNVIPKLKSINPSVIYAVSRMTANLRDDSDFLEKIALSEYENRICKNGIKLGNFTELHKSIAKRVIILYYNQLVNTPIDSLHLEQIYSACLSGGKVSLPQNMYALAENGVLKIKNSGIENTETKKFNVEIIKTSNDFFKKNKKVNDLLLNNALDCDKIVGSLIQRTRQSGDSISLFKRNGTKTLKKLYTEYSIPICDRNLLPVLADDVGVVWIYGIGVAKRCAIDEGSRNILTIKTTVV